MKKKDVVRDVAHDVRKWAEKWNRKHDKFHDDLCGMCAIAAGKLHYELAKKGIKSVIIACRNHCFVVWNRHVVDVTATQFGLDPIVIKKRSEMKALEKWHDDPYRCKDVSELIRHQIETGWPPNQRMKAKYL